MSRSASGTYPDHLTIKAQRSIWLAPFPPFIRDVPGVILSVGHAKTNCEIWETSDRKTLGKVRSSCNPQLPFEGLVN